MLTKIETVKKGEGNKAYKRVMDNQRSKSNSIFNSFIADPKAGQRTMGETFTSGMFGTRI